jgi:hypothetical protein
VQCSVTTTTSSSRRQLVGNPGLTLFGCWLTKQNTTDNYKSQEKKSQENICRRKERKANAHTHKDWYTRDRYEITCVLQQGKSVESNKELPNNFRATPREKKKDLICFHLGSHRQAIAIWGNVDECIVCPSAVLLSFHGEKKKW